MTGRLLLTFKTCMLQWLRDRGEQLIPRWIIDNLILSPDGTPLI